MTKKQKNRKTSDGRRVTKKKSAQSRSNRQSPIANRKSKRKRPRLPISAVRLRRLAFACEHIAEADQVVGLKRSLAEAIASHPPLARAWERGQLLRNLEGCAAAIMTVTETAKRLTAECSAINFESGQKLRELLDTDGEVRNIWEQKRIQAVYESKQAIAARAKAGDARALKLVEIFLRDEGEGADAVPIDYGRLGVNQLAELFGVSRQAVYDWYTKQQLARNADGTFDLKVAIGWFEQFTLKKASRGKEILGDPDPLRTIKAQRLALELERQRGQLLDREAVVAGQAARHRNLVDALGKLIREGATMIVNQPIERIKEILAGWRKDVIVAQRQVPDELELNPSAAAALDRVYELLNEQD